MSGYTVRIATEPDEFDQIHALNYRTFVEEVPQHEVNDDRRLVDRFHDQNTYVICKVDEVVVGMICVRDRRPFSVDEKIGPFEEHLPPELPVPTRPCEIRLLAIEPDHRGGRVIFGLLSKVLRLGLERGYDLALMSGRPANMALYRALGFRPFGPLTGSPEAPFQPMYATAQLFALAQGRGRLIATLPAMLARGLETSTRRTRPGARRPLARRPRSGC
jgi:GNAT superfamily N-acetyltransferase